MIIVNTKGIDIMGCFYVGYNWRNTKNGYFKIGETGSKTPAKRLQSIRANEPFECLGYLILKNETKSQRLAVESYVRMQLDVKDNGLKHDKQDHFKYKIFNSKQRDLIGQTIANAALDYAKQACKLYKIEYTVGKRTYKR